MSFEQSDTKHGRRRTAIIVLIIAIIAIAALALVLSLLLTEIPLDNAIATARALH